MARKFPGNRGRRLPLLRLPSPGPFHEDYCHVFPVLVPFLLGYVGVVERLGRVHPLLSKAGIGVALRMVASSVAFFAPLP